MITVYIDMDGVLCDFEKGLTYAKSVNPGIDFPQKELGFWTDLEPIAGGIETVKWMIEHEGIDPFILTAPSVKNPLCYLGKRLWIEDYFDLDFCHQMIISPDKSKLIGHYLIDDFDEGKGQDGFTGELIHFGQGEFPDWQKVRKYLELKIN